MSQIKSKPKSKSSTSEKLLATVIAAHGRHYLVQAEGIKLHCVTRGKKVM